MIKKRTRESTDPELAKAKEAATKKELRTLTIYVPIDDVDALNLYALKNRTSVSEVMRGVIQRFLDTPEA
jgi:hypothetical protein